MGTVGSAALHPPTRHPLGTEPPKAPSGTMQREWTVSGLPFPLEEPGHTTEACLLLRAIGSLDTLTACPFSLFRDAVQHFSKGQSGKDVVPDH